jgi:uncharacterized protein (TIGR04255 family)
MQTRQARFPADIHLNHNPLVEAWLEIRWELENAEQPGFMQDPGYAFALGTLYGSIKSDFPYIENTDATQAVIEIPYVVRHRFRPAKDQWPILQIGPGVASVNLTESYTWDGLKKLAGTLAERLLEAYSTRDLKIQLVSLKYRNAIPFAYSVENIVEFLQDELNTVLQLPTIPGYAGSKDAPTALNFNLSYDLATPKGTGTIQFATGTSAHSGEVAIWDLVLTSGGKDVPDLRNIREFNEWLEAANMVLRDWFFSIIEGPMFEQFRRAEE